MLPERQEVDNLKQLILASQDNRSAQQILLDMLRYYDVLWQMNPQNYALTAQILTVIQAYYEFSLPSLPQITAFLSKLDGVNTQQFLQQINVTAMQCKPTMQTLRQLLRWQSCRKNPLLPSKNELLEVVYQLCRQPANHTTYHFMDEKHHYCLYWQQTCWQLKDCHKQLVWQFNI